MMQYGIYPTTLEVDGELINLCPDNARKSLDGTKWICHDPQYAPQGVEPLQVLTMEEAQALMQTSEWSSGEEI